MGFCTKYRKLQFYKFLDIIWLDKCIIYSENLSKFLVFSATVKNYRRFYYTCTNWFNWVRQKIRFFLIMSHSICMKDEPAITITNPSTKPFFTSLPALIRASLFIFFFFLCTGFDTASGHLKTERLFRSEETPVMNGWNTQKMCKSIKPTHRRLWMSPFIRISILLPMMSA